MDKTTLNLNLYFISKALQISSILTENEDNRWAIAINDYVNQLIEIEFDDEEEEFTLSIPLFWGLKQGRDEHLKLFKSLALGMQLFKGGEGILVAEPYEERLILSKRISVKEIHPIVLATLIPQLLAEAKQWTRILGSILDEADCSKSPQEILIPIGYHK